MKNENTTDAICVDCGHTIVLHFNVMDLSICSLCPCKSFTPSITDELCVDCGHTDHTKYDDGLRGICMNSECDCTVFTPATSGEGEAGLVKLPARYDGYDLRDADNRIVAAIEAHDGIAMYIAKCINEHESQAEQIRELKRKVESAKSALTHYADGNSWQIEAPVIDRLRRYIAGNNGTEIAAAALKELEDPG